MKRSKELSILNNDSESQSMERLSYVGDVAPRLAFW